jgi:hypothetical protein
MFAAEQQQPFQCEGSVIKPQAGTIQCPPPIPASSIVPPAETPCSGQMNFPTDHFVANAASLLILAIGLRKNTAFPVNLF